MSRRTITAMVLAYVLPGAGHLYLGRRARAMAFFAIVIAMFVLGILIDGDLYTIGATGGSVLKVLASLGSMGGGAMYFIAAAFGVHGNNTSITYEHGTAFTITAGLMNLLLVLDAFDIAEGRKE